MIQICTFKSPALTRVARSGLRRSGVFLALAGLACLCAAPAQAATLGTTALTEGSAAGSNGVVLAISPASGTWIASANDAWLHLNPATTSGAGSTNVLFNYDANPGATRHRHPHSLPGLTATFTQASPWLMCLSPRSIPWRASLWASPRLIGGGDGRGSPTSISP